MRNLGDTAAREAVLARVAGLTPDARRRWGRMTAHGMLCHLADSFRVPMGERRASMASGIFQRTVMKWGALYVPMPWPHSVATRPEMEQGARGTPPGDFAADRAEVARLIGRFAEAGRGFEGRLHPLFGPMTPAEWMRWGFLHADHHLRQFGM